MNISCAILAGGKNSRFGGKNKSLIQIDGKTIIERNVQLLKSFFSQVFIISNVAESYQFLNDVKIVSDDFENVGPIGGIYTALNHIEAEAVFVFAGDLPFLNPIVISKVLSYYQSTKTECVITSMANKYEPLHSIYQTRIKDKLKAFILENKSFSVLDFYKICNVAYCNLEYTLSNQKSIFNINTQEDWQRAEKLFKSDAML